MKRFGRLEVIAFTTGFVLLCFELVAARLLAPSIGSSTYVWTSVIGVIIAALAAGYCCGGVIADTRNARQDVAYLLLGAAMTILFTQVLYPSVLDEIASWQVDARLQGVAAAIALFAPASFLLGMISPYLAKLNVTSLSVSGRRVASLGALNSIGGIVGTFLTGFVLISVVGSHQLLSVLVTLLVVISWLLAPRVRSRQRLIVSAACLVVSMLPTHTATNIQDIDTPSAHYQVITASYDDRRITGLTTGPNGIQSAVYDDTPEELVFWYTREMAAQTIRLQPRRVLMLGGGTFTLPSYVARKLPEAQIDVVEIDPRLLDIARERFQYRQPVNVTHYFQDARSYVNQSQRRYDVILVDVYGDGSIPFTFTTEEFGGAISRILDEDGIAVVNVVGGLGGGGCEDITRVVDAAYRSHLPHGYYTAETQIPTRRDNIVMTYSRRSLQPAHLRSIPFDIRAPFTDNLAPTEQLYNDCLESVR